MKEQDYRLLELLLGQLKLELGHNFCIVPNHIQDGYYIGIYDSKGSRFKELSGPDIKSCVDKMKESSYLIK